MTLASSSLHTHTLGSLRFPSASRDDMTRIINEHLTRQPPTADAGTGFSIGYINPHVYNQSLIHADITSFINQCNLVCLDGLGACIALKSANGWIGTPPIHRVVALQLFDALIHSLTRPCTAVLIGVEADELEASATAINRQSGNLTITATMDGFQSQRHYEAFLSQHAQTDWVLIGAGSPKSEGIALQARRLCPQAIVFHMGAGSIKVYGGSKRRAPLWISRMGLEWAHRIVFEPHTRERYTRGGWQFFSSLTGRSHRQDTKTPS